jgi:hypothetical protein
MSGGKVMAEERVETVVKVFDPLVYSTQEQFEDDRAWTAEDSKEGDLDCDGYPPAISMPEYAYNAAGAATHYRSRLSDISWCADYEGYVMLNGPTKVNAGVGPGPAANPANGWSDEPNKANWGPDPTGILGSPLPPAGVKACGVSTVMGFNLASVYPNQSPRYAWHKSFAARHPEYSYNTPNCHADGKLFHGDPLISHVQDVGYQSGILWNTTRERQCDPLLTGANFWDNGCDLTNFGIYINQLRRNRFHTIWADEVPSPDATIEMTVKPEVDLWNWATNSKMHSGTNWAGTPYQIWPCSRQFFFDWGVGGTRGMNYTARCYAQTTRIYLELFHHPTAKLYVLAADHAWKPHTWHHLEVSWVSQREIVKADGTKVVVPPNAMLFVDGRPATAVVASGQPVGQWDVNSKLGFAATDATAMVLPENVKPANPNVDVGVGPRFAIGSTLAPDGSFGMSSPRWHGLIDNLVMHSWRSHGAAFTPRNRYHSTTYYDGAAFKSGEGYKGERAGVYKKRLTYLENLAKSRNITVGTVGCTHYHPFHVHLYGHDGAAPTTAFGHITPALRIKTGVSFVDQYYYDGCVGVPVKAQVPSGAELYYLGWFEVASLVPVTMSPILCDIRITYFDEPVTYYRLSSSEAKK